MRKIERTLILAVAAALLIVPAADAQITVTVTKQIEAGSDNTAMFDFPGVAVLGDGQMSSYMFTGGVSLLFEQPPDATWQAPTINCLESGAAGVSVTGPFEVTITDMSGGTMAGSADCTFVNRQAPTAPATPAAWLALLAFGLLAGGYLLQRRRATG